MHRTIDGSHGAELACRWRNALGGALAALALMAGTAVPAAAQVSTVDPDAAIDADIVHGTSTTTTTTATPVPTSPPASSTTAAGNGTPTDSGTGGVASWKPDEVGNPPQTTAAGDTTYKQDDLIGAAEGVFGKGASGLAGLIEDLLRKQGEPNGYIVGREGGGAIAVGLRYGSGTLFHKVEGQQPVYWTGPSLGFDVGANASSAFVLVYNLNDTEELYHRFVAGEGQAYLVGGFTVSYLRRGNVVLIPVRSGAGLRLGANIGYMKFSHKQKWLPF
ncbi:DUF1134 domain-containing protein [Novosphingobium colocasiae]|uniref:DUF1134 domain-containing protein n=1 Tax=Novosphingobium colocasiae TaxID=1256513 RepID=UPI0035B46960